MPASSLPDRGCTPSFLPPRAPVTTPTVPTVAHAAFQPERATIMPNFAPDRLADLVLLIARAMGSDAGEARDVADHLVAANLAGHDSHGVGMLPDYVRMLQAGLLVP